MIERTFDQRVHRLVHDYGRFQKKDLAHAFKKIEKRLGGQHLKAALEAIEVSDGAEACAIALSYYDKAYDRSTIDNGFTLATSISTIQMTDHQIAKKLILTAEKNGL